MELGKNLTGSFTGLGVSYPETGLLISPDLSNSGATGGSAVVVLDKIYAINSLNSSALDDPYFIIGISGFQNQLKTTTNEMNNIMSVVSRYNSYGQFTSFYSEGNTSVPYTHMGLPVMINNLNVKIMNGDKEISDSIGSRNSIYIEHISTK